MKDEEMAEEYARKTLSKDCCDLKLEVYKRTINSYLAGLKACRPQWHILSEEPNVLPEEGQEVKVLTEEGKIEKSTYFYDTYYEEFAFSNIGLLKVFAWCEILTFDKE